MKFHSIFSLVKRTFFSGHFLRFLVVGTINTSVDFAAFLAFTSSFHLSVVPANILSTSIALCLSFVLNKYFVFKANQTHVGHIAQFVGWTLLNVWVFQTLVILASKTVLQGLFDDAWKANAIAKVLGIGVSMILNFLGYKFIFSTRKTAHITRLYGMIKRKKQ